MYKRLSLFLLLISPLFFIVIGYPIVERTQDLGNFIQSRRCFVVGEATQFFTCFDDHARLGGMAFITNLLTLLNLLHPHFGVLLTIVFLVSIVLTMFLAFDW
jgi:hypothetical protein